MTDKKKKKKKQSRTDRLKKLHEKVLSVDIDEGLYDKFNEINKVKGVSKKLLLQVAINLLWQKYQNNKDGDILI